MIRIEGKVANAFNKAVNLAGRAINTYDTVKGYLKGDRDTLYNFSTNASKEDLEKTDFKDYIEGHLGDYKATKDPRNNKIRIDFDTTKVSKTFADNCQPGSKEGLAKYITGYKNGKATMILPMSGKEESLELDVDADESMMTPVQVKKRYSQCDSNGKLIKEDFYEDDNFDNYEEIGHKYVYDFDGFTTDYTMYRNLDTGMYVMIFGDRDIYSPNNTEPDAEFETREEADEWFDSYEGFVEEDDYNEESLTLKTEDYWFGGDGKTASDSSSTEKPFNYTDTPDLKLDLDTNDEEWKDEETESLTLDETPGLTLSTPEVNSQGILEIEINGKKYRYTCDNPDMSSKEVADKVSKMKKYSDGKALAYLKKNMKLVNESVLVSEKFDGSVKDDIRSDITNAFYDAAKNEEFGFESNDEIDDYLSPVFVVEDYNDDQIRVEVRLEGDFETMGLMAEELNPVVQKYDKNSYFDFVDTGIMEAIVDLNLKEEIFNYDDENEDRDQVINDVFDEVSYMYGGDLTSEDAIEEIEASLKDRGIVLDADDLGSRVAQYNKVSIRKDEDIDPSYGLKSPHRGFKSSAEDKLNYIKKLVNLAKDTGDAQVAWELVDFLYDINVDDLSYNNESVNFKESLDLDVEDESVNEYHIIEDAIKEVYMMYGDFEKDAVEEIKRMIKEKDVEISDSDLDDKISEFKRYNIVESNSFKQHHVCQTCGNTLDKCTCKAKGEEEESEEECIKESIISVGQELTSKSGNKIKITNIDSYMSRMNGDPYIRLYYDYELTNGEKGSSNCNTYDMFRMLQEDNFSGATQVSNVGQYKRSSIDMTSEDDKENKEDA